MSKINGQFVFDELARQHKELEAYRSIGTVEECRAAMEKQKEMITYCDENDCSDCPFHNTSKKYNKCMNDFIAEEIVKGGGVNEQSITDIISYRYDSGDTG